MFWGLIMEPNKRYTQTVEKPFHISQAAMDISTGDNEACQVMIVVDGKNFLVCTLQKGKTIQVPLDLYFKAGDGISFLTNGKCNVHLTGYLDPEFEDDEDAEEEEDEEEEDEAEVPELVPAKNKRKLVDPNESKNKKAKNEKKKKAADSDSDDDDEEDQLQKLLSGDDIDTDDNDESFKINTSAEVESDDDLDSDEEVNTGLESDDVDESDNEDSNDDDEADTTMDTSKEDSKTESQVDMSKLTKSQRRRLKKKLSQEKNQKGQPKVNGVDKVAKKENQQKAEKKKPEVKKEEVTEKKEKKGLSGGVQIEDLKVGSGPLAKPGKVVMVYYEGRLKQNNKMFDNCNKGPGFKFKLGAKEVISGWDIGVNGMKVGGKRKIVCPPAMAYGAKGSPPVIPPNSTLVFEVELKNVK